ncbi:SOUL family heme-binding protein [Oculatella sp. LEGE 06141]|uniref:SOUL family heme-binding protein n=1 Tax=Oculatella sp. LEGE 06141 TaxID=1828648 RepID=UPI0030DD0DA1
MSQYEEAKYSVLQSQGDIEIRQYEPKLVAETVAQGTRDAALNTAFSILVNYILGENMPATEIAMTVPVTQAAESQKIAMTAPVLQQELGQDIAMTAPVVQRGDRTDWVIQFVMPTQYTLATLPKPNDSRIAIKEVEGNKVAAIRFSGSASDQTIREKEAKLRAYLNHHGIDTQGSAMTAFYDSPFTLPFFRRNEIMIELK